MTKLEDKYPLCEKAGLLVVPALIDGHKGGLNGDWVKASDVEAMLENAPKVSGNEDDTGWIMDESRMKEDTHTARLVMIEEIKKDTAESLLREVSEWRTGELTNIELTSFISRARKLLEPK